MLAVLALSLPNSGYSESYMNTLRQAERHLENELNSITPTRPSYSYNVSIDANILVITKKRTAVCIGTLLFEEKTNINLLVLDFNRVAVTYAERMTSDVVSIEYIDDFQRSVRLQNLDYIRAIRSRVNSGPSNNKLDDVISFLDGDEDENYILSENCRGEVRLIPLPSFRILFYVQPEFGNNFVQLLEGYQNLISTSNP